MNDLLEGGELKLLPWVIISTQTLVRTRIGVKAGAGWVPGNCCIPLKQQTLSCQELHRGITGSREKEHDCGDRLPLLLVSVGQQSLAVQGSHCTVLIAWGSSPDVERASCLPGLGTRRCQNLPFKASDQEAPEGASATAVVGLLSSRCSTAP